MKTPFEIKSGEFDEIGNLMGHLSYPEPIEIPNFLLSPFELTGLRSFLSAYFRAEIVKVSSDAAIFDEYTGNGITGTYESLQLFIDTAEQKDAYILEFIRRIS
jgi:hypothetical protein